MNQKGYTLIELLVYVTVGSMIMGAVAMAIFQLVQGSPRIRGDLTALADVENVAHWLTRDIPQAQATTLVDSAPPTSDPVSFDWADNTYWAQQEGTVAHFVIYTYSGTGLQRNYDNVVTTIGRHLTNVGFSLNGQIVTVTLTSSPDSVPRRTVTRSYDIRMRTTSGP